MVARLGGDEFVVLLEDIINPQDAARVAEEIIADLSNPFKLSQSDEVKIGVSIGISLYPQHGGSLDILWIMPMPRCIEQNKWAVDALPIFLKT